MKLLFLSNLFPDTLEPYRGLDNACLLHHLTNTCEIRAISPRPALPFKKWPTKVCRKIDRPFEPMYLKTFYVPKIGSLFNHRLFAQAIRQPLLDLRKTFPFDIILCSWVYPDASAVAQLQSEINVPFVAIAQGSDVHAYLRIPARRQIITSSLNKSLGIITRSAKLAALLQEAGVAKEKLHPVYNGVDLDSFQPGDKQAAKKSLGLPDMPILLFVGNFLPVKNPFLLIQAHAELCRKQPAQLVMIGGGPLQQKVREAADAAGFGQHVILAGRKTSDQIANYMRASDVLCMSSENEGVPNVILESFASGLRVVSTDVGGIKEVLNQDFLGKLVERGNVKELTTALSTTLQETPQTEKIRQHGLRFSWNRAASEYLTVLQSALK